MAKKTIGITGMAGFVGSHLRDRLAREERFEVLSFEDSYYENPKAFIDFAGKADAIVHLAGVNRDEPEVIYQKNIELMQKLLEFVDASGNKPVILFSSSTQIDRDNEYAMAHFRLGNLMIENGRKEDGKHELELAVMSDPDFAQPYNELGLLFLENGDYNKAL